MKTIQDLKNFLENPIFTDEFYISNQLFECNELFSETLFRDVSEIDLIDMETIIDNASKISTELSYLRYLILSLISRKGRENELVNAVHSNIYFDSDK